jgi:prefoldin beta subunit
MEEELEKALAGVQVANQQIQSIMMQKQALSTQLREIDLAIEELDKAKDDVYRSVGPILVKSDKASLKKELSETKERIELHIKGLDKQEKNIKDVMSSAQSKLQKLVKPSHGTGS